jgi:hypothetical protein
MQQNELDILVKNSFDKPEPTGQFSRFEALLKKWSDSRKDPTILKVGSDIDEDEENPIFHDLQKYAQKHELEYDLIRNILLSNIEFKIKDKELSEALVKDLRNYTKKLYKELDKNLLNKKEIKEIEDLFNEIKDKKYMDNVFMKNILRINNNYIYGIHIDYRKDIIQLIKKTYSEDKRNDKQFFNELGFNKIVKSEKIEKINDIINYISKLSFITLKKIEELIKRPKVHHTGIALGGSRKKHN